MKITHFKNPQVVHRSPVAKTAEAASLPLASRLEARRWKTSLVENVHFGRKVIQRNLVSVTGPELINQSRRIAKFFKKNLECNFRTTSSLMEKILNWNDEEGAWKSQRNLQELGMNSEILEFQVLLMEFVLQFWCTFGSCASGQLKHSQRRKGSATRDTDGDL